MEDRDMKCYKKDYPRPQFVRDNWVNLNGTWDFGFDDANQGEKEKWYEKFPGELKLRCPSPMRRNSAESRMRDVTTISGITRPSP